MVFKYRQISEICLEWTKLEIKPPEALCDFSENHENSDETQILPSMQMVILEDSKLRIFLMIDFINV